MLPNITLQSFSSYRTGPKNWSGIPIEFLDVFRRLVTPSQYKYNFKGWDTKGRPSYLKLYADTFSVSFRESEVEKHTSKRQRKAALKEIRELLQSYNISTREVF